MIPKSGRILQVLYIDGFKRAFASLQQQRLEYRLEHEEIEFVCAANLGGVDRLLGWDIMLDDVLDEPGGAAGGHENGESWAESSQAFVEYRARGTRCDRLEKFLKHSFGSQRHSDHGLSGG